MDNIKGLIFDIQHAATHDGPGTRTTVFLKGCPLRCVWCHNPEGVSPRAEISFRAERCTGCHSCAEICPEHVHQFGETHSMKRDFCQACAMCVSKCPMEALRRVGEWMMLDQVLAEVEMHRQVHAAAGGGMTLSGGEPMLQFTFAQALLLAARQRGIHTCLETCGYAARARYQAILPLVDLFLFDYKATNAEEHARLTGVSNRAILSNLDFLLSNGAKVILRCPLVPGINDHPAHLQGIAALARRYPQLAGIEIMAYRDTGESKAARVGKHPALHGISTADETLKADWIGALHALGCEQAVIG